jgi:hypothetical protein
VRVPAASLQIEVSHTGDGALSGATATNQHISSLTGAAGMGLPEPACNLPWPRDGQSLARHSFSSEQEVGAGTNFSARKTQRAGEASNQSSDSPELRRLWHVRRCANLVVGTLEIRRRVPKTT